MFGSSVHRWSTITLICIAILAAVAILVVHQTHFEKVQNSKEWVDHTQGLINQTQEVSAALQRAIISQRAYLVTRKKADLATYREQADIVKSQFQSLHGRVRTADQKAQLDVIDADLEKIWGLLDEAVDAIQKRQPETAFSDSLTRELFTTVTKVQDDLAVLLRENRTLLLARTIEEREEYSRYIRMMLVASLLSLLTLGGISLILFRAQARQVAMEEELKQTKERLDLAIKGASDGVWDWNILTGEMFLSPRFKEIVGHTDSTMPSTVEAATAAIHPEDREKVWNYIRQYLAREVSDYQNTYRVLHRDGSVRWVLSRGIALWNARGEPYRMVGVHTDITAQKKLEDALREAINDAEIASHAKSEFLANMSHEIRTPMNAIIGIANILARCEPLTPRQQECIEALQAGAKALHGLLNDILDLSKLESGMVALDITPFSLSKLVTEATTLAGFRAHEKGIALHVAVSDQLPELLLGDGLRIRQIINNLLSNAIKFTESGTVSLHVGATQSHETGPWLVEIRVKDSGIGIPLERQEAIFEKFTQSDPSISRQFGGTGLGLAICRQLVEQMNGFIRLESEPGAGAEFIVTLPLEPAPAEEEDNRELTLRTPDNDTLPRGSILIVEDYKPNILVARSILEEQGYDCDTALNGKEALDKLCADAPHGYAAVLMDVQLPDMDGFDITRNVREHEAERGHARTPIIAMTAHALLDDRDRCLAAGMDDYISKPFDPEDLAHKLAHIILAHRNGSWKNVA